MLHVNFKAYNSYVTDSLYQWDINQSLNITGLNLADAPEVHFANANMERAIVRPATIHNGTITVIIPNSLLQEPLPIKAYIGVYEGETYKIIESIKIPVIAKARPMDYSFVDDGNEVYSYNEILNTITRLENKFDGVDPGAIKNYSAWVERINDTYSKGETITDETKALYGLGNTAVPNDLFRILGLNNHRVVSGEYLGTGTTTLEEAVILTFDFQPKLLIITTNTASLYLMPAICVRGSNTVYHAYALYENDEWTTSRVNLEWGENVIKLYGNADGNVSSILNRSGTTYHYVAIG